MTPPLECESIDRGADAGNASRTTVASYTHAFITALEQRGVDAAAVFAAAAVPMNLSSSPLSRLTPEEVGRLFAASVRLTGDPYFGLLVGEKMQPANLHALGFGLLASTSLRDFFQRISNYYRVVSQNADFGYYEDGEDAVLRATNILASVCDETVDAWVVLIVRFIRQLVQSDYNPRWIQVSRPCPAAGPQPYLDYFRCPVHFDQPDIRIAVDRELLDRQLAGGNRELALINDQIVMGYIEKLDREDVVSRVRRLITLDLASRTPTKQGIAAQLHMSPRTLQEKLAARKTTFQGVLDQTREALARGYIEQSHLGITEIAYLLGFADASNFTRAFRRWTGCSPSEYRGQRCSAPD